MTHLAGFVPVLMGIVSAAAGPNPPQYSARFVTPGIDAINAAGMNASGDIVGTGTTGSGAWVSLRGAPAALLPLPAGDQHAIANDINDAGVIVGSVGPSQYPWIGARAVAWIPDRSGGYAIQELGRLPGHASSAATAINELGDIVGWSFTGMFRLPVLFAAPGEVEDLSPTGVFDPKDINNQRVLVDALAQRLDLNTMIVTDLGAPGPSYAATAGEAINESGQVAGRARLAIGGNCDLQAARYTDGVGWEILSGCGSENSAWDINDVGDVVMRLNVAPYMRFEGIGTFLIEDLIVADVGHWYVVNGYGLAINNARQLAVPATNPATNETGVILLTARQVMPGDIDGDGDVDTTDLNILLSDFGCTAGPGNCPGDADGDGDTDTTDLNILLSVFGA